MKIDVYTHIFPKVFFDKMISIAPNAKDIHKRIRNVPCLVDLEERFRIMDRFDDYVQIICLSSPIEVFGAPPYFDGSCKISERWNGRISQ